MNDINLIAEQFQKELINLINEAGSTLPPALVYYIIKDVYNSTSKSYKAYLDQIPTASIKEETDELDKVD